MKAVVGRFSGVGGCLFALLLSWWVAQPAIAIPDVQATSSVSPPSWHLSRMLADIETTQALHRDIEEHCATAQQSLHWRDRLAELDNALEHSLDSLSDDQLNHATLAQLFNLQRKIGVYKADLDRSSKDMTHAVSLLEVDQDRLVNQSEHWQSALMQARSRSAPPEIVGHIESLITEVGAGLEHVLNLRNALLIPLDRVAELRQRIAAIESEISERRRAIDHQVRTAASTPIWQKTITPADLSRANALGLARTHDQISIIVGYWHEHWLSTTGIGLTGFLLAYSLLLKGRGLGRASIAVDSPDIHRLSVQSHLRRPLLSALSLSLFMLAFLAPEAPTAFYDLLNLVLPPLVLLNMYDLYGSHLRASLVGYSLSFLPMLFWGVLELLPVLDHWVLLSQGVLFSACLAWDLRQGSWQKAFPKIPFSSLRLILLCVLGSLVSGVVATILGYLGFARVAIWSMILLLSDIAVFGCVAEIIYTLGVVWFSLPWMYRSLILPSRRQQLIDWLRLGLGMGVGLYVMQDVLDNYGWLDPVMGALKSALFWQAPLGGETVTLAQILLAAALLLGTFLGIRVWRVLLEEEIFPRIQLPLGVPFAISTITRYLAGLLGFVWAMAAVGFDLSKVTLLAGALGVGVGFGLQNIFNNFASGLILLFERPINVGDVIEMGKLIGIVRRIGIRSSTVRTMQGAEVIVPNAELVAKPVINWTLSDRLRRMEIDLAVESVGPGVEAIVHMLEDVARKSTEILKEPPPYALFTGFSDGHLNFRLCAWINRFENEPRIASAVRRAVMIRFTEEGVGIPDPVGTFYLNPVDPLARRAVLDDSETLPPS